MMASPAVGQRVVVRYSVKARAFMPLHGKEGVVVKRAAGRPKNHLVEVDGKQYVIPCGNLFPADGG